MGEHPPYRRLPYRVKVPDVSPVFQFAYGISSAAFDKPGDGVGFTIEVKDATGKIRKLFSNYIDPKHNLRERKWMDGALDLSAFRGQTVDLLFSTDPGPRGDTAFDWAGWSNFHFASDPRDEAISFKHIFHGNAQVYEYDHVLPRAAVFSHVDLAASDEEMLRKLADPAVDIFTTVVLNKSKLDDATQSALQELNRTPAAQAAPAEIASYLSQSVMLRASLKRPGVLMLNDTADPDWTVKVDGRKAQWFAADYMFRGVLLPAGAHIVQFSYRPRSFYLGALLSGITALLLIGAGFFQRAKRSAAHA